MIQSDAGSAVVQCGEGEGIHVIKVIDLPVYAHAIPFLEIPDVGGVTHIPVVIALAAAAVFAALHIDLKMGDYIPPVIPKVVGVDEEESLVVGPHPDLEFTMGVLGFMVIMLGRIIVPVGHLTL